MASRVNYNPITGCVSLAMMPWMYQHKVTILNLIAETEGRDTTGVITTKYKVNANFVDILCVGTGGGISAALKNERWEQDQMMTVVTDVEPPAKTQDAFLFARNVFLIDSVEPIGALPCVAWRIHGTRIQYPDDLIRGFEADVLAIPNEASPNQVLIEVPVEATNA